MWTKAQLSVHNLSGPKPESLNCWSIWYLLNLFVPFFFFWMCSEVTWYSIRYGPGLGPKSDDQRVEREEGLYPAFLGSEARMLEMGNGRSIAHYTSQLRWREIEKESCSLYTHFVSPHLNLKLHRGGTVREKGGVQEEALIEKLELWKQVYGSLISGFNIKLVGLIIWGKFSNKKCYCLFMANKDSTLYDSLMSCYCPWCFFFFFWNIISCFFLGRKILSLVGCCCDNID